MPLSTDTMQWEEIVGASIRRARQEQGLTQEELALAAGVDLRYLGSIERGRGNPSVGVMGRLANALGVHPQTFFNPAAEGPIDSTSTTRSPIP